MAFNLRSFLGGKKSSPPTEDPTVSKIHRAVALHQAGNLDDARKIYREVLDSSPQNFDALHLLGIVESQSGNYASAVELIGRAICVQAGNAAAHLNLGLALRQLGRRDEAIQSFDRAVAIRPEYADAHLNRGLLLYELERFEPAVESFDVALSLTPDSHIAWYNRGNALQRLRRFEAAIESYDRAIALRPEFPESWYNRGNAFQELGRLQEAVENFDKALEYRPDYPDALCNRGIALHVLMDPAAALPSLERALELQPDYKFLRGVLLLTRMDLCDWNEFDEQLRAISHGVERGARVSPPFPVLATLNSPRLQRMAAEIFVSAKHPENLTLGPIALTSAEKSRIRVGYFSSDFHEHPVSYLTVEFLEMHDRERFETIGFSLGGRSDTEMRRRISAAFDQFVEVGDLSDVEIAKLARTHEIDIAMDLAGHTEGGRVGIFAARAAPIQASYIGYLGTMGAPYFDYLLADSTIVPESAREHYCEKIAYLPTYQANDSKRIISDRRFSREDLGLPREGFVFCCLNNTYKITPQTFSSWMRILDQVEGSVILLHASNAMAAANLRREADARRVDPRRLVFAERLPRPEYFARFRTAGLFLDTFPYNAGTVASDALWAGLPVLTRTGDSFASRVAASVLHAAGLPELVTRTEEEYERRAEELAKDGDELVRLVAALERLRASAPLFDTPLFVRRIEALYAQMYDRRRRGLPPEHLLGSAA